MKTFKFLEFEKRNAVFWIYFNRPEVRNAFSLDLAAELLTALKRASKDKSVAVIVISGRGQDFSAGGDIKMMGALLKKGNIRNFFLEISQRINACVLEIRKMPKPVIAAIPGYVGGIAFGFCLSADFRVASSRARFQAATIHLGLVANGSATYFLPKLVGTGKAAEILLTGKIVSAEEALQNGLVHRVFSENSFSAEVQAFAEQLATLPGYAQGCVKQILNAGLDTDLVLQLSKERQAIAQSSTTKDYRERVFRFLEK
jgi:2-(1,2-epoxy-1,2-dihydrophenyl)acetyl-CoA isomerase